MLSLSALAANDAPAGRSWFKRTFTKPTWEQALRECSTPEDVCRIVAKHVGYREEDGDHWSTAHETWDQGVGDCEDFALLIKTFCEELGFDAQVELFYTAKPHMQGHAVVRGECDGRQWLSSNGSFRSIESERDAKEIVARIFWCDASDIWVRQLADDELDKMTGTGAQPGVASASLSTSAAGN